VVRSDQMRWMEPLTRSTIGEQPQKEVSSQKQCIAPMQQRGLGSYAKPATPFHHHNAMIWYEFECKIAKYQRVPIGKFSIYKYAQKSSLILSTWAKPNPPETRRGKGTI
jgi:hypothetical protein